jgi:hypothetical protein
LEESKYKKSNSSEYAQERQREQRERLAHLGLSEVEAVEYVLMLSRDEANNNASGSRANNTQLEEDQGVFEGEFDTEHNTDNDEADDDYHPSFTHSTASGSRRSSTSSTSIPSTCSSHSSLSSSASLSSRSNWTSAPRTIAGRRSISPASPSLSNEKIQVSPPFKMEAMEAGEWLVDYNAVGSVSASLPNNTNTSMGPEMEAHIFPPIVSGKITNEAQWHKREDDTTDKKKNGSKGKKNKKRRDNIEDTRTEKLQEAPTAGISSSPSSAPSASARNIPFLSPGQNFDQTRTSNMSGPSSPSTSASASTAPRNAWTSGGPSLSARISPPTAAATSSHHHYQQHQGGRRGMNSNMDLDEDLRLAIELSLIEARSRGEDV